MVKACSLFDSNKKCESNLAKLLAADASWQAADVYANFGWICFSEEYNIERKFRETRLYRMAQFQLI